ncbi:MAG: hypothetical protein K6F00_10440, partial [Lachnospiraceae bacterium]|nr:hypothetical protein [Lachnospiraceae bacterium]
NPNASLIDRMQDRSLKEMSQKEIESIKNGRLSGCINNGKVEASLNLGGIVGTLGIESDIDPEEDIRKVGNSSYNYVLQSESVMDSCKNYGEVYSRKNYVGGIAGKMDLGLAHKCENYGIVNGEGGSYVGGITGFSEGAVRNCFSKCEVSGIHYVGGIAGFGDILSNNISMIRIPAAERDYGAIAGGVADRDISRQYDNCFVAEDTSYRSKYREDEKLGAQTGIGGKSFIGMSDEITYEQLLSISDIPEDFKSMKLTFKDGDTVLKTVLCDYGESLEKTDLPEIPAREGYTGKWDRNDFTNIKGDDTVNAVYLVEVHAIASEEMRDGKQSVILVDGKFARNAKPEVTKADAGSDEIERWHIKIAKEGEHTYHFLPPTTKKNQEYYVEKDGKKTKLSTGTFGRYITYSESSAEYDLIVAEAGGSFVLLIAAAGAILVIAVVMLILKKKRVLTRRL